MNPNKRMYIDYPKIEEMINIMTHDEFIQFLDKRVIIPIDDDAYEFLLLLKNNNLNINKNNKK
jgi:hypothetical protein